MAKLIIPYCDKCFKPMDYDYFWWKENCKMDNQDLCIRCRMINNG